MAASALVTGSSRGIGKAVAEELAREGWDVCINYIEHRTEAEALAEDLRAMGRRCITVRADVADAAACQAMVRQAERLVENEFAFSLGLERQEVGPYIHDLWTRAAAEG